MPDRDLIVALTADEEGGGHNGVVWLLKEHRALIDAELAINEGGVGDIDDIRAHGRDERMLVRSLYEGQEYLYRLVKALSSRP